MKNHAKNARIQQIQAESERAFSNYVGPQAEQLVGVTNYSNMGGAAQVAHSSQVRILTFNIENTDETQTLVAPLFSANERIAIPFNGVTDIRGNAAAAGKGIIIDPDGYSQQEMYDMAQGAPFTIAGLRYDFTDQVQRKQRWEARYKRGTAITIDKITLFKNLNDSIDGELEDANFVQMVDGGTTILIPVAPAYSATEPRLVQVSFKVAASFDPTSPLTGQSAIIKHGPQYRQQKDVRVF